MVAYNVDSQMPNQSFTVNISGHSVGITLQTAFGNLFSSVSIDGVYISSLNRCVQNKGLIPYGVYAGDDIGNFYIYSKDENYPTHSSFESDCLLVYLTKEEIESL